MGNDSGAASLMHEPTRRLLTSVEPPPQPPQQPPPSPPPQPSPPPPPSPPLPPPPPPSPPPLLTTWLFQRCGLLLLDWLPCRVIGRRHRPLGSLTTCRKLVIIREHGARFRRFRLSPTLIAFRLHAPSAQRAVENSSTAPRDRGYLNNSDTRNLNASDCRYLNDSGRG